MCGISGIYCFDGGAAVHSDSVQTMLSAMAHRGPDNKGIRESDEIILGHRRLAIIDLKADSNQPMISAKTQNILVYNGEIYNYLGLRQKLKPYFEFKTDSDTEVLLAALEVWGADALLQLNGMFAFAFWDAEKHELLLGRDRLGIKPLYFVKNNNWLAFASEQRPLIKSKLASPKLNSNRLAEYLQYQTVFDNDTLVDGIKSLPAGHLLRINREEERLTTFWNPTTIKPKYYQKEELKSSIKSLFTDAVQLRMQADVSYGAFLSGGIDSSAIVAAMSETTDKKVDTFSLVFEDDEFTEDQYSTLIAKKYNTNHHRLVVQPNALLDALPQILQSYDSPSADGANSWLISQLVKKEGITMALSGLGGDELFAGYPLFTQYFRLQQRKWVLSYPKILRKIVGQTLRQFRPSIASDKIHETLTADYWYTEHVYPSFRKSYLDQDLKEMVGAHWQNRIAGWGEELIGVEGNGYSLPVLSKLSVMEMQTYMKHVLLRDTDQMSMAHALEVRVPFLDHRLVELVLSIPDDLKYPDYPKKLLVESLGDWLPDEIVHRPKMGFVLPWEKWLKNDLRDFCEAKIASLEQRQIFRKGTIVKRWRRFLKNDPRLNYSRIWQLVVLEEWLQNNSIETN